MACVDIDGNVRALQETFEVVGQSAIAIHPSRQRQHSLTAVVLIAELFDAMAYGVGKRQQQAIVGHFRKADGPAHVEIQAVADEHERNVIECVRIPLAQLVGPDDERVIQQAAAAGLGRLG